MKKSRLYYYSTDSLDFVEAKWTRTKLAVVTLVSSVAFLVAAFEVNHLLQDPLGIGFNSMRALVAENTLLKNQLNQITRRLAGLEYRLNELNEQNNELRLVVDLPKIDEETRMVGVGGAAERIDFSSSIDVNQMLRTLNASVSRAERELQLQFTSYNEAVKNYEENKIKFAHLPAIKPMQGFYSPQGFGMRLHPVLRIYKLHEGLDIVADVGTPVYAAGDGVVEYAGRTGGGYGILVEINHGYGYTSLYAHLDKVLVREGQRVKRGDLIARSGRTGLTSGPHLHYEVRYNGVRQNPIDYFFDDIDYQQFKDKVVILD
ncbi:MAG TPA: M23 family metallopeptidase [Bacteroidota bacterium]|nr:M23 family metallopeptidase [Bacteroidota bacterium]